MEFKTERLEIKPLSEEDREPLVDLLTNGTVKQTYMLPDFASREEAAGLFHRLKTLSRSGERYVAGVYLEGNLIGLINDTGITGRIIELGYAFLPGYYGRGYATETLKGAIAWLFARGFQTVVTGAFEENRASVRVMVKSGMKPLDRQEVIEYRGKQHRCVYYAIGVS